MNIKLEKLEEAISRKILEIRYSVYINLKSTM